MSDGGSVSVFFTFASGLAAPVDVPVGTLARCRAIVARAEETLGLVTERYLDNPPHWRSTKPTKAVTDAVYCELAMTHNRWVRQLYDDLGKWSTTSPDGELETLTPQDAATFWHGLVTLDVPPNRWTPAYYRDRMEHLYEVLRGRPSEGTTLGMRRFTPKEAAAVIWLFEPFLGVGDLDLEVPKGHDFLASRPDGEYDWCERCGAVTIDDANRCRKRKCPVREGECACRTKRSVR